MYPSLNIHEPSLDLHERHIDLDINLPHGGLDLHGLSLYGSNIDLSLKKPSIDLHGPQFSGLNALLIAQIDAEINLPKKRWRSRFIWIKIWFRFIKTWIRFT